MAWGVSQGEQFWGGLLKKRIPPWFPCVTYTTEEQEICRIMGEGVWKGTWKIGQEVTVLYDPKNPRISMIEGDVSLQIHARSYLLAGIVMVFVSVIAIVMFLC